MSNQSFDEFKSKIKKNLAASATYDISSINQSNYLNLQSKTPGEVKDVLNIPILETIWLDVLEDKAKLEKIENLEPGAALYFKKTNAEDRTYCVLRKNSGEYILLVEPKMKFADGEKDKDTPIPQGADKYMKIAWEISGENPRAYASVRSRISADDEGKEKLERLDNEVKISNLFPEKGFSHLLQGPKKINEDGSGVLAFYSEYRAYTLDDLLSVSKTKVKLDPEQNMSEDLLKTINLNGIKIPQYKVDIIRQLLEIRTELEKKGIENKDIKPHNLLIDFERTDGVITKVNVEITDWGYSLNYGDEQTFKGSLPYMNPGKLLLDDMTDIDTLSNLFKAQKNYLPPNLEDTCSKIISKDPGLIDGSHDAYAIGAICYELIYGEGLKYSQDPNDQQTKNIESNPLLNALLQPLPVDAGAANKIFNNMLKTLENTNKQTKAKMFSKLPNRNIILPVIAKPEKVAVHPDAERKTPHP